jgi:hypothetical protein
MVKASNNEHSGRWANIKIGTHRGDTMSNSTTNQPPSQEARKTKKLDPGMAKQGFCCVFWIRKLQYILLHAKHRCGIRGGTNLTAEK